MAIISGMKAAVVDDVKPFELPVELMATGILERQKRADKAKELYGIGASAMNFKVRDREQDYAERQKLLDRYNANIAKLADAVGGDWSEIDNSQIQAEAMKITQDKNVGHLITAREQSDLNEKLIKEIEKEKGFALRFGEDPFNQDLFNEDGSLKDLTQWSVQKRLDWEKAADDKFDHIVQDKMEQVVWAYSGDLSTDRRGQGYPVADNVTQQFKDKAAYDFLQRDWLSVKDNEPKVLEVINNIAQEFMLSAEGGQYYAAVKQQYEKLGYDSKSAADEAKKACIRLLNTTGRKRITKEHEVKSDRFIQPYPKEPSMAGPRPSSPGKKGGGGSDTENKEVNPMNRGDLATREGLKVSGDLAREANNVTSKNFNNSSIGKDFTVSSFGNVHALGNASTLVPNMSAGNNGSVRLGLDGKPIPSNAKERPGFIYRINQNTVADFTTQYGNNRAAIRIGSSEINPDLGGFGLPTKPRSIEVALEYSGHKGDSKTYGKPAFSEEDLLNYYLTQLRAKDPNATPATLMAEAKIKVREFIGGEGSDFASMYKDKYDETKGYSTYEVPDEFKGMEKNLQARLIGLETKGVKVPQEALNLFNNPDADPQAVKKALGDLSQDQIEYLITAKKLSNLQGKIKHAEEQTELLNTPYSELLLSGKFEGNTENARIAMEMEHVRNKQKSLQATADQYRFFSRMLAVSPGVDMTLAEYEAYVDPSLIKDKAERSKVESDIYQVNLSKIDAVEKVLGSGRGYDYFSGDMEYWKKQAISSGVTEKDFNRFIEVTSEIFVEIAEGTFDFSKIPPSQLDTSNGTFTGGIPEYIATKLGISDWRNSKIPIGLVDQQLRWITNYDNETNTFSYKHTNFKQNRNQYNAKFSEFLSSKGNINPKYVAYVKKMEEARYEIEGTADIYFINPAGNEREVDMANRMKEDLASAIKVLGSGEAQNRGDDGVIVRMHYGTSDPSKPGVEERINLGGDLATKITAGYKQSQGKDEKGADLTRALLDDNYTSLIGMRFDPDHHPPLRLIFTTSYLNDAGELQGVKLEVPAGEQSYAALNTFGIPSDIVEYHREISSGYKGSGNLSFDLTVPSTRNTAKPSRQRYYKLPFDLVIGGEKKPRGTILTFDVDDENKSLMQLIGDVDKGTNAVRFFNNELAAMNNFHENFAKPSPGETAVLTQISNMQESYNMYVKLHGNKPNFQIELNKYLDRLYGPGAYLALKGDAKEVTPSSFNEQRRDLMLRKESISKSSSPILSTKYDAGSEEIKVQETVKDSSTNLRLLNAKNNSLVTEAELTAKTDAELAKLYANKNLKQSSETVKVAEALTKGDYEKKGNGRMMKVPNAVKPTTSSPISLPSGKTATVVRFNPSNTNTVINPKFVSLTNDSSLNFDPTFATALTAVESLNVNFGGPLEITKGQVSIESNLSAYKEDYHNLSNSAHLYGRAIDISTQGSGEGFSTPGYKFLDWCSTPEGEKFLSDNKLRVSHSKLSGEKYSIKLEYNTNPFDGGKRVNYDMFYTPKGYAK